MTSVVTKIVGLPCQFKNAVKIQKTRATMHNVFIVSQYLTALFETNVVLMITRDYYYDGMSLPTMPRRNNLDCLYLVTSSIWI